MDILAGIGILELVGAVAVAGLFFYGMFGIKNNKSGVDGE